MGSHDDTRNNEPRRAPDDSPFEKHEPPHKKVKGVPLPRFGSAASGGLEYEPGPERHTHPHEPDDER